MAPVRADEIAVLPAAEHRLTVIYLHPFCGSGVHATQEFAPLFARFPSVRFVFPTAPTRRIAPQGGRRAPSWFDYLTDREGRSEDLVDQASLRVSRAAVQQLVWREARRAPVVLAGDSQGGCMALSVAARPGCGLRAVVTCVAHRLAADRRAPLQCPWHALSAELDDIFPASWASCEGAASHEVAPGASHYLERDEGGAFLERKLGELLEALASAPAAATSS